MMGRFCLAVIVLGGCGRIGFASARDGAIGDDDGTVARLDICSRTQLVDLGPSLEAGETITKLRVTPASLGRFAVVVGTSSHDIHALHLDASLTPEATLHRPLAGTYALYSAVSTNSDTFVWVDNAGSGMLERLDGAWDGATMIDTATSVAADPALADWQTVVDEEWMFPAIDTTGKLAIVGVLNDGSGFGLLGGVNYHPAATSASVVARPDSLMNGVVVALGGVCQTFVVDAVGQTSAMHTFAPSCSAPTLSVTGADPGIVAYEDAGQIYVHLIPSDASQAGITNNVGAGSEPRLVRDGTRTWVVWRTPAGQIAIGDLDPELRSTQVTVEAAAVDVIAVSDRPHLMWIAGSELWDGQPCVP
jgi:hypothetical protein